MTLGYGMAKARERVMGDGKGEGMSNDDDARLHDDDREGDGYV